MFEIAWFYWVIMAGSITGGISSFLNFHLQRKWYIESQRGSETIDEKVDRLLRTKMPHITPKDGL